MRVTLISRCVAVALCATIANAQGTNDCASAQPISGLGVFPFDNTAGTTDGPADCSGQPVRRDVWFDWTAPTTIDYKLKTCFLTSLETRVAVYDGTSCPPTLQLACSHAGCTGQTILGFPATAGQHYLIRVGSRGVGPGNVGSFRIEEDPCPTTPDDGFEDNDDCASAVAIGNGTFPGLFVSKADPDWYAFDLEPGGTLNIDLTFTHATGDIDIFLYNECGPDNIATGGSGTDNETISYQNVSMNCQRLKLAVDHWLPDLASDCQNYTMTVSGSGTCPAACATYCSALPNATGSPAVISCSGDPTSSLVLTSTPVPNTTGQFFFGPMMLAGNPFGDGLLCVGGALTRIVPFVSAGMMMQLPNTATLSINYGAPYASGLVGNKYFQHWFRSGLTTGDGYNTSDGLEVTF